MSENAIVVRNACKRYGQARGLDDVSLEIPEKSVCCLLGPNGSGKTTLLNAIAGGLKLDSGSVRVKGRVALARQTPALCEDLTVKENLDFFSSVSGGTLRETLVKALGLQEWIGTRASSLSAGTRKRLEVAIALLPDPDVILLDEPTTGVDAQTSENIAGLIQELKKKKTVVIATHQLADVKKICGSCRFMKAGKVLPSGKDG